MDLFLWDSHQPQVRKQQMTCHLARPVSVLCVCMSVRACLCKGAVAEEYKKQHKKENKNERAREGEIKMGGTSYTIKIVSESI